MISTNWDKVSLSTNRVNVARANERGVLTTQPFNPTPRLVKLPTAHNVQKVHFFTVGDAARWLREAE